MGTENLNLPLPKPPLYFVEKGDLFLWRAWINNTAFSRTLGIVASVAPEGAEAWFEHISESTNRRDFVFKKDDKIRAFGGFTDITSRTQTYWLIGPSEPRTVWSAHIYMFVYPSLMNLGVGDDVVESLCSYGFKELGLNTIYCRADAYDFAKRRAYERCGFLLDGPPPERHEDYLEPVHYSLWKDDWEKYHLFETGPQ